MSGEGQAPVVLGLGEFLRGFGAGSALHLLVAGLPALVVVLAHGPRLLLVPLLGIGLFQLLYLPALGVRYARRQRKERLFGIVVLAVLTFLLNGSAWLWWLSYQGDGGALFQ